MARRKSIILRMPAGDHRAEILASLLDQDGLRLLRLQAWNIVPPILPFDLQIAQRPDGDWTIQSRSKHDATAITFAVIKGYRAHLTHETYRASGRLWTVAPTDDLPRIITVHPPAQRGHQP
jgi:hypothetical protein